MSSRTAEFSDGGPCINHYDLDQLSADDRQRIERIKQLLPNAFATPEYTSSPQNVAILAGLKLMIANICAGQGTIEDFLRFRDQVFETPEYGFLAEAHPWLNKTGWGLLLTELDPLKYGRGLTTVLRGRSISTGKKG